uniref:Uncharacterized protein n=1 Tax=Caenorhabditis japonica TaxID=281687 RepID=A0A8R1E9Y7_CAEJA
MPWVSSSDISSEDAYPMRPLPRAGAFQRRSPRMPKYSDSILHTYSCRKLSTSIPSPLDRRQGRSCEFHTSDDDRHDRFDNPIAQVSSDILRVSGYTQQFRSLLTARFSPSRDSTSNVNIETGDEENKNG